MSEVTILLIDAATPKCYIEFTLKHTLKRMPMKTDWKKKAVRFIAGQTISLFGSSLVQYAIMWHITLTTNSGVMMMLSIICGFLPNFFLSPFAGVWADRFNRKTLIVLADGVIASVTLLLAILFMMGINDIWLLFVISAVRSLGTGIQVPAVNALIPQIVPEDKLTRVNAVNGTIQSVITLVSPMASGALLAVATIDAIFFVDVFTAAIAILIMLFFLHVPTHEKAAHHQTTGYFSDFKSGLSYIKSHPFVLKFLTYSGLFSFLVGPAAFLTPLQVTRSFNGDVWHLSAIEIAFSGGMVFGGLILAAWGGFKNRVHTIILSGFCLSILTVALGVIPEFWIYLAVMALIGLALPLLNTPSTVLLQEKVEESYMGRVFGVFGMIASAVMPLSMLVFGPLSDTVAIEWLLVITGILMLVVSVIIAGSKTLIKAGEPLKSE